MSMQNTEKIPVNQQNEPKGKENESCGLKGNAANMLSFLQEINNPPTTEIRVAFFSFILSLGSFYVWTDGSREQENFMIIIIFFLVAYGLTVELYYTLIDENAKISGAWFWYKCIENILTITVIVFSHRPFEALYFIPKISVILLNTLLLFWVFKRKNRVAITDFLTQVV